MYKWGLGHVHGHSLYVGAFQYTIHFIKAWGLGGLWPLHFKDNLEMVV